MRQLRSLWRSTDAARRRGALMRRAGAAHTSRLALTGEEPHPRNSSWWRQPPPGAGGGWRDI